jgi:hypothetical protein
MRLAVAEVSLTGMPASLRHVTQARDAIGRAPGRTPSWHRCVVEGCQDHSVGEDDVAAPLAGLECPKDLSLIP